ncbi:hypothetical protein FB567DRAFT_131779 [Paraphoma chrysanthemicola]|uniref:Uncharacterized protein n=1 Tax=Paraphoma chrysanthemicola TaxID=798071 RepID=A0A8K0R0B5_9PLEO|nr:hypothetical protein FB567DRAFT_131779 [Paraphoma chrysanthemicola]
MAANAPYYQMRSGQFITGSNSTNAPQFAAEEDEDDLSAAAVASPNEHHPSFHSEHPMRQTSADTTLVTMEENHNLADLLEAATTAAGEAVKTVDDHEAVASRPAVQGRSKRKRGSSPPAEDADVTPQSRPAIAPKRRRVNVPTDPQLQDVDHEAHGNNEEKETSVSLPNESLISDARAAGVHSAAALFRRTSERTSRKYTRPPMSKLFMSLQLSPENFLQLQAHAKTYMLDTAYPERQNCVGNRGKGDTDMVKLRLFNCVRDFLNDGVGEQFFGENVEKPGENEAIDAARALGQDQVLNMEEKLSWPRDGNKIISLVTPLMRRMVTNERQRMYAIETRKGGTKKKDKEGSVEPATQQAAHSPAATSTRGQSAERQLLPAFDPSLSQRLRTSPSSPTTATPIKSSHVPVADMGHSTSLPFSDTSEPHLNNINIFLVLAPRSSHDRSPKCGPKLDETRICKQPSQNLITYPWSELVAEIATLLDRATARYPALRQHAAPQNKHSPTLRDVPDSSDRLTDNLQELAAAANAMQGEHAAHVGRDSPGLDVVRLPAYVIKTVGPSGWEVIDSADEWNGLLKGRASEVWADGVVNLVVELVDGVAALDVGGREKLSS